MIIRKLLIIIMGIFLVLTAGVCNLYPIYLSKIKDKFGFTIKEVNLFGTFINIGLWVAFPMGYIYDRLGPKLSCFIGAFLLSGSYLSLYFIIDSAMNQISLFILLFIALIMGQGSALCYTTSVTTNLKNFRFKESSSIVGLLVANLALSPSIFTTYRKAFKDTRTASYFLGIAIFSFFVIVFSGFIFQNLKKIYSDEESQKTYEKYKEKKIIRILIIINIITLIIYTFSVIYNHMQEDRIPLVIIYPCLQSLNFIVIVLEKANIFDKLYFEAYVNKKLVKNNSKPLRENTSILSISSESLRDENNHKKNSLKIRQENNKDNGVNSNDLNAIEKLTNRSNGNASRENLFSSSQESENANIIKEITTPIKKENSIEKNDDEKVIAKNKIKEDFTDINLGDNSNDNLNVINVNINFNDETKIDEKDLEEKEIDINLKKLSSDLNKTANDHQQSLSKIPYENKSNNSKVNPLSLNISVQNNRNNSINSIFLDIENDSMTLKSAVMTKEFLNLIIILIFGIGSVIANLNNISFIYESITLNPNANTNDQSKANMTNVSQYVILYFVFNSFARIISGLILDHLIKIKKFIIFLIFISVLGFISQILGLFMNKILLLISICFAGATHGGYMTFTPIYVRNEYGLTNMGKILGLLTSGCAIGSFFIADFIFIIFYEWQLSQNAEAKNLNASSNVSIEEVDEKCYGEGCFRYAYLISSILFLINIVLSYNIYKRYKKKHENV